MTDPENAAAPVALSIDFNSADGRAGLRCLLAEIERRHPGMVLQAAARIELARLAAVAGARHR